MRNESRKTVKIDLRRLRKLEILFFLWTKTKEEMDINIYAVLEDKANPSPPFSTKIILNIIFIIMAKSVINKSCLKYCAE